MGHEQQPLQRGHRERGHSGNGRKAEGSEGLKRLLDRARADMKNVNEHRNALKSEISILEVKIADAEQEGSEVTHTGMKLLRAQLTAATKTLQDLEKVSTPTVGVPNKPDLEKLISRFERVRTEKDHAERRVNKGDDPKAAGDFHRAQAEAAELVGTIEDTIRGIREQAENAAPERSEGIHYTHEQAVEDERKWEEKHPEHKNRDEASVSSNGSDNNSIEITSNNNAIVGENVEHVPNEAGEAADIVGSQEEGDWQDKAISTFEKNGGKTGDFELLPMEPKKVEEKATEGAETTATPEESERENTSENNEVSTIPEALPLEEQGATEEAAPSQEHGLSASTKEKVLSRIREMERKHDERAEKLGILDQVRKAGEYYRGLPMRTKLLISGGLILSGVGSALIGSTVAAGAVGAISFGMRGMSGAAMFTGIELWMKNRAEKEGVERSADEVYRDTARAAIISIALAGFVPMAASHYLPIPDAFTGHQNAVDQLANEARSEAMGKANLEVASRIAGTLAPASFSETAVAGDTVWGLAKKQLGDHFGQKFADLSMDEQNKAISSVVRYFDNPNQLAVGQEVDFTNAFEGKHSIDELVAAAPRIEVVPPHTEEVTLAELDSSSDLPIQDVEVGPDSATTVPSEMSDESWKMAEVLDPETLAEAAKAANSEINTLFGSKGIFGFFPTAGINSLHWMDPTDGFANRTVEHVIDASPLQFPTDNDGINQIGINNYLQTVKMREYLVNLETSTGISPDKNEAVSDYIKRVMAIYLNKDKMSLNY